MNKDKTNLSLIPVAKIVGTHGVKGLVEVLPYSGDSSSLSDYEGLTDKSGKSNLDLEIKFPKKNIFVCQINSISSVEDARILKGSEIFIP